MIGRMERVPLRSVWPHEALDFTRWLRDNIEVLNEVLDITLANAESEQSAGAFNVDLVAEDDNSNPVVIENQLERSNHDHLGKVITYLTSLEAVAAVWIVAEARPEHVKAIAWLNESAGASFYLVKVEAIRIDDSPPAPLLTLIVGPSEEARSIGRTRDDIAERYVIRREFWTQLLDKAKTLTSLHASISPTKDTWVTAGAGKSGLGFAYVIHQHDTRIELYIDRGKETEAENDAIFNHFLNEREQIEAAYGGPIEWQRLEGKRACRIKAEFADGGYRDLEDWGRIQDEMIDGMIRFADAFRPHIDSMPI